MQGAPRNGTGQCSQSQAAPAEILLSQTQLVPTPTGTQDSNQGEQEEEAGEDVYAQGTVSTTPLTLC